MKSLPLVLGLSLAANVAFYVTDFSRSRAAQASALLCRARPRVDASGDRSGVEQAQALPRSKPSIVWEKLRAGDPAALTELRAADWPEDVLRSIVVILVDDLFREREAALRVDPWGGADYWKERSYAFGGGGQNQKAAQALAREKKSLLQKILGPDFVPERDPADQRYAMLSPEKAAAVTAIMEDYQTLRSEIQGDNFAFGDVTFPEDREKRAFLLKEQRADIARTLTPDELLEYDLRNSSTAATMRTTMEAFEPTEQEFRSLFPIQFESDERMRLLAMTDLKAANEARAKAKLVVEAQIQQLLGGQRYAELARSRDNDFRRFYQLGQLLQLAPGTATAAYEIKTDIDQRARALKLPPTPDADAVASLTDARLALATEAETRLAATLGPRGLEVFQANSTFLKDLRKAPPTPRASKPVTPVAAPKS